jgi:hypothetical protein
MFRIFISLLVILTTATVFAAPVERQGPGRMLSRGGDIPQGFSPNGTYASVTATNATFHDLTNFLAFSVYCPADCGIRFLPTAAKGTYPLLTLPGLQWHTFVKNTASPFISMSTASNAAHQWMQQ